jgi:hypothetical protein
VVDFASTLLCFSFIFLFDFFSTVLFAVGY